MTRPVAQASVVLPPTGSAEPTPFDLLGPLPDPGVTMLEASAGTGKTFTIAALVTRYVAAGTPVERILAVTFTRMATAELRSRVRDRLVSAEAHLGRIVDAGSNPSDDDELVQLLARGTVEEVDARRRRLSSAIANFDAATITTTHGFCHLVLASLGTAGSVAPGAVLVDDAGDTVEEVVEDLYLRHALMHGRSFPLKCAQQVVSSAVENPDTSLFEVGPETTGSLLVRLAKKAREEVSRRLIEAGLLTYDDLLVRLKDALVDEDRGKVACGLLRDAYSVVLVDEFQDTDPIQWDVVKEAFGTGDTTLVMIGDPKQAIYSFRGGDVYSYLDATATATRRYTLTRNWRSDAGLLAAYDALFDPIHLGHSDIPYRKVASPESHHSPGVEGLPVPAPLRIRLVGEKGLPSIKRNQFGAAKPSAEEWIARDLADDVVRLLRSGARLTRSSDRGEPITPGRVAVLVRTNRQAACVESALVSAGVPAVMGSSASVFETEGGRCWLKLLEALERPALRSRAAALALTPLLGLSASQIACLEEAEWEAIHAQLHGWADILRRRNVAALFREVLTDRSVPERVLSLPDGARFLTDLAHVAQLLHAEAAAGMQGPTALHAFLARRISDATDETGMEERSRRLDSDADAVQVLTIHRAKGLEFPIVYCPFLWDAAMWKDDGSPVIYHEPGHEAGSPSSRRLDVTGIDKSPTYSEHRSVALDEQRGEELRLLYVALTRARHQAVLWWVGTRDSYSSPLARVLLRKPGDPSAHKPSGRPKQAELVARVLGLADRAGEASVSPCITAEICTEPTGESWERPHTPGLLLEAAEFSRPLDRAWRRSSYSSMTASDQRQAAEMVSSEPEDPGTTDEPDTQPDGGRVAVVSATGFVHANGDVPQEGGVPPAADAPARVDCPLAAAPGGTEFGTFVHHVLERVDFADADLASAVGAAVATESLRRSTDIGSPGLLVEGLVAAIDTPLGPLAGGASLRGLRRADRVDELSFELPLAGGDRPTGSVATSGIAELFDRHLDPDGPLRGYPPRLLSQSLETDLRGYLTGSLDLVFKIGTGYDARFFIADYKTNRLAGPGEALTAWHYRPEALDAEMQQAHYPLQAILYSVALHRYLRWRLPGYSPGHHLGGVLYLFVRGMTGRDCPMVGPHPCGVFSWAPPCELVMDLSDLFDRGGST
jgi:exodeoxyribonuclease V beta subunit